MKSPRKDGMPRPPACPRLPAVADAATLSLWSCRHEHCKQVPIYIAVHGGMPAVAVNCVAVDDAPTEHNGLITREILFWGERGRPNSLG